MSLISPSSTTKFSVLEVDSLLGLPPPEPLVGLANRRAQRSNGLSRTEANCKLVLVSDDYYPTLTRPNVELVTDGIAEVRAHSIVTNDGVERPIDVLIFGTGFRATEPLIGIRLVGRGGVEIHDAWRERMSAYLGVTVSGFPNLFLLLGPNTGLGHNSVVLMIEAQVRYVMSCLALLKRDKKRVLEVRQETQKQFVADIYRRLEGTVWQSGGCHSWYQDQRTGENTTL